MSRANPSEYLQRTDSAVRHLFDGIGSCQRVLAPVSDAIFVSGMPKGRELDEEFAAWQAAHAKQIQAAEDAVQRFAAEAFALDTLCGSVLAVAEKALELFAPDRDAPPDLPTVLKPWQARYCVGRLVRGLPLGLIVHAARNQHAHHEEIPRELGQNVFHWLASGVRPGETLTRWDPAFDAGRKVSLAGNVTALIGWRSHRHYVDDMHAMLLGEGPSGATPRLPGRATS